MVEYWFPYAGHPDGESKTAWFRVENGAGYRTADNPAGESDGPCFLVVDGSAYPSVSFPGDAPTFEVIGSFVYAPLGPAWFHIVRAVH